MEEDFEIFACNTPQVVGFSLQVDGNIQLACKVRMVVVNKILSVLFC